MLDNKKIVWGVVVIVLAGFIFLFKDKLMNRPATLILQVPFSSQAPSGNWDNNEDCEETSIVMANAYLTGNTENILPAAVAQAGIDTIKKWEQANLGYNVNTGANTTALMATLIYNLKIREIDNFTEQDLKDELLGNHPILLPVNALLLDTPKYRGRTPFYHMIVIRGYNPNAKGFIVNDPGTEDGNGNVYSFATLENAAADWNHDANKMEPDKKVALAVSK